MKIKVLKSSTPTLQKNMAKCDFWVQTIIIKEWKFSSS